MVAAAHAQAAKPKAKSATPVKQQPAAPPGAATAETLLDLYTRTASAGDLEREAGAAAGCAGGGGCHCSKCRLSAAPGPGPYRDAEPGAETQPFGVVVDDGLALAEGQVHRTPFIDRTTSEIEAMANRELSAVGKTAEDCPYLTYWLRHVRELSAAKLERMIEKYARPERADADGLRQASVEKARSSILQWIAGQSGGLSVSASIGPVSVSASVSASISLGSVSASASFGLGGLIGSAGILQTSLEGSPSAPPSPGAIRASLGAGRAIEPSTRARMERSFGQSFASVRVHTDRHASRLNRSLAARAFAIGDNIAFGEQHYRPGTLQGDLLLAHELAHVVQQRNAGAHPQSMAEAGPQGAYEADADRAAISAAAQLHPEAAERAGIDPQSVERPRAFSGLALRRCGSGEKPIPTTTADFEITGKVNSPGEHGNIYFERGSSTMDAVEQAKIPNAITAHGAGSAVFLDGFASEDETSTLADDRNTEVTAKLRGAAPPHAGPITPRNQAALAVGDRNYRSRRKVNLQSTVVGAPPPAPAAPACVTPVAPCGNSFVNAHPRALTWMTSATAALSAGVLSANTTNLLNTLFGGVGNLGTVRSNVAKLDAQVRALPAQHRCHSAECDSSCSRPAYNCGSGVGVPNADPCDTTRAGKAMMTLCPEFINSADLSWQASTLIHEAAHGTDGLQTEDIAYAGQRSILALTPDQALKNTDSYTLLIANTHAPGTLNIGPAAPDTVDAVNCPGTGATTTICKVVAFLEKWVEVSEWDVGNAYGAVHSAIQGGRELPRDYHRETIRLVGPLFGLTAHNAKPTADDRIKLAGIYDRILNISNAARTRSTVTTGNATESWTSGYPNVIALGAPFAGATTDPNRVRHILSLLVSATSGIDARLRNSYVEAADRIRKHKSLGPA